MSWQVWVGTACVATPVVFFFGAFTYMAFTEDGWRGALLYWAMILALLAPVAAGVLLLVSVLESDHG